jgi:TPR repeat protein
MNMRELLQNSEAGSAVAQCVLRVSFSEGTEVQVDYQKAFRFLSAAADPGASRAIFNLARMHAEGLGIPRNPPEAIRFYESIGKAEFLAAIELGRIYSRGMGVANDEANASHWYLAAVALHDRVPDGKERREAKAYLKGR